MHTQKLKNFCFFKLSYSKFVRDLQNTQTQTQIPKKLKIQIKTQTFWFYWVNMAG